MDGPKSPVGMFTIGLLPVGMTRLFLLNSALFFCVYFFADQLGDDVIVAQTRGFSSC